MLGGGGGFRSDWCITQELSTCFKTDYEYRVAGLKSMSQYVCVSRGWNARDIYQKFNHDAELP